MTLGAFGGHAELLTPAENTGFGLALKGDAFLVRTESDAIRRAEGNIAAMASESSRLRLGLEGRFDVSLDGGATLSPSLELGLRKDGGDTESGAGVEVGGGIALSGPSSRVSANLSARTLVAHAESGYREWGASAGLRIAPDARDRGISLSLASAVGADEGPVNWVWAARNAKDLAPIADTNRRMRRLDAEFGYGLPVLGDRFTGTPWLALSLSENRRDYRIGWRLRPAGTGTRSGAGGFQLSLEASRSEHAKNNAESEHGIGFLLTARW